MRIREELDSPARLEALYASGLMDTEVSERYDRLTKLASQLLGAPIGLMSLVDANRQFFKSFTGLSEPWASARETPLSHSFCQHVVTSGEVLRVEDAPSNGLVKDNLAIPDLGVIAYLGVPIVGDAGHTFGSLCVIDTVPRKWSDREEQVLIELVELLQTEISLKLALAEADRQGKKAEAANRAKSDFLARMSHELRTPLNSVIGFANVLLRNKDASFQEKELKYLERIQKSGIHLLGLINDLLDLAKIESGKLELNLSMTDLKAIIEDVVAQFEVQAGLKNIELATTFPDTLIPLETDPVKLTQILTNLVGNALKFTHQGRVSVNVVADASGRAETISVEDSGIGIDSSRVDAIFEAYEQAGSSTAAQYGGTGLGLPISRALCEMIGCSLEVTSRPGSGSIFTITLQRPG